MKKKGSVALGKSVKSATIYTRFIRWFKTVNSQLFILGILQLIYNISPPYLSQDADIVLSMDRTIPIAIGRKLGIININILMIGLVLPNGKFIPLYFELLDKRGNSSQDEREGLMDVFQQLFSSLLHRVVTDSLVLVGDREFIGQKWFKYLQLNGYKFIIRIRRTDYRELLATQMKISVNKLDNKIRGKIPTKDCFIHPIIIKGKTFYYCVT